MPIHKNALISWKDANIVYVPIDHAPGGPCDIAEHAVVDPVGI